MLKPKDTELLGISKDFVWIYLRKEGNTPEESKQLALESMAAPKRFSELGMVTGMIGIYSPYIPLYDVLIIPLHHLLRHGPPSETHQQVPGCIIGNIWQTQHKYMQEKLESNIKISNTDGSRICKIILPQTQLVRRVGGIYAIPD